MVKKKRINEIACKKRRMLYNRRKIEMLKGALRHMQKVKEEDTLLYDAPVNIFTGFQHGFSADVK